MNVVSLWNSCVTCLILANAAFRGGRLENAAIVPRHKKKVCKYKCLQINNMLTAFGKNSDPKAVRGENEQKLKNRITLLSL